ncbi:MerR family transcriptional regulator [Cellulomonas composti]|uniref:Transcriptional regulator n=1 Tax=Cellulomonas composti TaxID=266130 RepID=A0A511J933_9CELL|nr:MerR family transcriptional regulator [Cellulomonas composti]GEL94501.1 transcriptional regulator [Cellulomonas composti]
MSVTGAADARAGTGGPLTVAAVAARLGVAPATLRTWDRRYGLGPSERSAGAHRRYTPLDVERLLVMRRLTIDGVAPGDAARIARDTDLTGSSVPVPDVPATPTALVDAALRADRAACARIMALPTGPALGVVEAWWCELVDPAFAEVVRRTVVDRPGVDAATVLHAAALEAIGGAGLTAARGSPIVLVLPVGERLALSHALAAALVTGGADARVVPGPLTAHHATELVLMTRPRVVVTVAIRADVDLGIVADLAAAHPDLPQLVLAPGAPAHVLASPLVQRARSFRGLLHETLALVAVAPNG